jgi:hypothetical protein
MRSKGRVEKNVRTERGRGEEREGKRGREALYYKMGGFS